MSKGETNVYRRICCEDDNDYANEKVREILDAYTWNKCKEYLNNEGLDIVDFTTA